MLGIHRVTLAAMEKGESEPSPSEIYAIASATGVDEAWLLTGKNYPTDLLLTQWDDFLPFIEKLEARDRHQLLRWLFDLLLPPPPIA